MRCLKTASPKSKTNWLYAALGASGGLVALAPCSSGACGACPGCAGVGICALLLVLFHKLRR